MQSHTNKKEILYNTKNVSDTDIQDPYLKSLMIFSESLKKILEGSNTNKMSHKEKE